MAILIGIVVTVVTGLAFKNRGLFSAASALISVLFSAVAGLSFGAAVAHVTEYQWPYTYALSVLGIGLLALVAIRGALLLIDEEVAFHPLVDRVGGVLGGAVTGLLGFGFLTVCVVLMPLPKPIAFMESSLRNGTELALTPGRLVARIAPGQRPWSLRSIEEAGVPYGAYVPPPPPPPESSETDPSEDPADAAVP